MPSWSAIDHIKREPTLGGWTVVLVCGHWVVVRKIGAVIDSLASWNLECANCRKAAAELGEATA